MENAWSRAKRALSQRLCLSLPRTRDGAAGTSSDAAPSSEAGPLTSSSTASTTRSSRVMFAFSLILFSNSLSPWGLDR
jgi:hypothetical protein